MLHHPRKRRGHWRHKKTVEDVEKHFLKRVYERCGVDMTMADVDELNRKIQSGEAKQVLVNGFEHSNNRQLLKVFLPSGENIYVIWDKRLKSVVTPYTEQMAAGQPKMIPGIEPYEQ